MDQDDAEGEWALDAPPAISSARSPSMNVADRVYNVVLAATSGDLHAFVLRNEAAVRAAIQVAIADAQSHKKAPPARRGVRTVEDAGAYLPGARKHMWTPGERVTALDLDDIEAAPAGTRKKYLTKQYVLGKFDWEAEQAAGVTPEAAVLKEKIWSSVAGFPEDTPTARKMYVLGADWLRAQLIGLANREDVVDFLTTWKATLSNTILGRAIPGAEIARMFGYDPENLPQRDASLRRDYTDIDVFTPEMRSENYAQRRQLEKDIKEHIAEQLDADELDYMRAQLRHLEAVGRLAITSVELARHGYKTIVHSAYQNQYMLGTGASYRAHLEAGPAQYLVALAGFDMREFTSHSMEPRSSAGQKQQLLKLVRRGYFGYTEEVRRSADRATWEKLLGPRAAPTRNKTWVRATENIKRVGPPTGRPANLSENDLLREFGFRGDQFGKSISDADRLKHRELAWDAFADLARILGIRRQEIGGCGLLGFAFGARGSGRAAAHYESINKITHEYFPVINLTNTQGDGAVAHEWGHFFDHHASESPQRIVPSGNSVEVQFASGGRGGTPHPHAKIAEKMAALSVAMRRALPGDAERVREEATAIYLAVDARLSELNTLIRAKAISRDEYETEWKKAKARLANRQDAKHSYFYRSAQLMGEYWERPTEMFARAFEAWIEDELHARGEVNTYLVHGTRRAYDFDITKSGDDFVVEPYPLGKERERINAAMRDLMTTVAQSDLLCRGR